MNNLGIFLYLPSKQVLIPSIRIYQGLFKAAKSYKSSSYEARKGKRILDQSASDSKGDFLKIRS